MPLDSSKSATDETEISLVDILRILRSAWKTIAITGVLGLSAAVIYLLVTPKRYEAAVQITMAQIGAANNSLDPLGINIEEPALLIARLSSPTSFTPRVLEACGYQDASDAGQVLSKSIKLGASKGVANVVDLTTFGPSPQAAKACTQSLFELIKSTQAQIVAPYIEEAKVRLADNEERLARAKSLVSKVDKSGQTISASYLSTRDEIRFLLDEITALKNVVSANQNRPTRLVAPIYASETPIAPKKRVALAGGLFGGLFLGLLFVLGRQVFAKLKSKMAEAL